MVASNLWKQSLYEAARSRRGPWVAFREIVEPCDLREHLRLRCDVYSETGYLPAGHDDLDVDVYDLRSRFLGAWWMGDAVPRMVGGVRMVHRHRPSRLVDSLREILGRQGVRTQAQNGVFPSEKAFNLSGVLARCDAEGLEVVEFSRTVCLREFRGMNVGFGLVNGIFGMAMHAGIAMGVGSTPPRLRDFYLRLGCDVLPAQGTARYEELNTDALGLLVDLRRLPAHAARVASDLGELLSREGTFVLDPEGSPESLHGQLEGARARTTSASASLPPSTRGELCEAGRA